ncbi:hypothetical protein MGH68_14050 [Erysipelothrix sp. D19-032]
MSSIEVFIFIIIILQILIVALVLLYGTYLSWIIEIHFKFLNDRSDLAHKHTVRVMKILHGIDDEA